METYIPDEESEADISACKERRLRWQISLFQHKRLVDSYVAIFSICGDRWWSGPRWATGHSVDSATFVAKGILAGHHSRNLSRERLGSSCGSEET
jgi:hypothetical protein